MNPQNLCGENNTMVKNRKGKSEKWRHFHTLEEDVMKVLQNTDSKFIYKFNSNKNFSRMFKGLG